MAYDYNFSYDLPYDFSYDLPHDLPQMGTGISEVLGILLIVYGVIALLFLAFAIVSYVLHSVGMYSLAKRRGIRKAWLAWIPIGNMWILGSISDQYQYVAKGKIRNTRKVLLAVMIAIELLAIPSAVGLVGMISSAIGGIASDMLAGTAAVLLSGLLSAVVAVLGTVFQYIAYHNLFTSSDPNNAVAFLIIGIFIPVTLPFFVFACRKKDRGMPPRKQAPQPPMFQPEQDTAVQEEQDGFVL